MQNNSEQPLDYPSNSERKIHVLGHEITLKLTCRETAGEYFVFEAITPVSFGVPLHVHRHEDEFFRVIDGEFEVQLDRRIQKVTRNEMVTFPKHVPHSFRNIGTTPGRTLWTVMPGANFEAFFEELASLPADPEPDLNKVTEIYNRYDIKILPRCEP